MSETRIVVIILVVLELIVIISNWLRYQRFQRLEQITGNERNILTGQMINWFILFLFIPVWIASIFLFGYTPLFSISSINIIPSLLGLIICLPFIGYISISAIRNQLFLFMGRGIKPIVVRGKWAIVWGVFLIGIFIFPLLSYL